MDFESEVQGFNTHWGNILLLEFFVFMCKASDVIIGIIAKFRRFSKKTIKISTNFPILFYSPQSLEFNCTVREFICRFYWLLNVIRNCTQKFVL